MPRSTSRRYAATQAATTVLLLGAATGCSEDAPEPGPLNEAGSGTSASDPTTDPSGDPSSSGSATPEGPPALPPEARGTTRASAGPFVRYWVDTYQFAVAHLAPEAIRSNSLPGCEACSLIARSLTRIASDGGHFNGSGWRLRGVEVL